jgi:hypothetical protein
LEKSLKGRLTLIDDLAIFVQKSGDFLLIFGVHFGLFMWGWSFVQTIRVNPGEKDSKEWFSQFQSEKVFL